MKYKFVKIISLIFIFSIINQQTNANQEDVSLAKINNWTLPFKTNNFKINTEKQNQIPLFEEYPELQKKIPHITLGNFPTPIIKLEKLGKKIGINNLYIKNDAVSSIPFGGNKIRKLEFLLADALHNNAKTVITVGDAGSNHALATIICAKKLGLKTYSMLAPQLNTSYLHRNLLLSLYHEGIIQYYDSEEIRDEAVINLCVDLEKIEKSRPYFIPSGGSCAIGSVGFVNAAFELKKQIEDGIISEPDFIYVTLGSTGTAAGLILGLELAGINSKVIPVRISGDPAGKTKTLIDILNQTNILLNDLDPKTCPLIRFTKEDLYINHNFAGKEYAQVTESGAKAIKMLFDSEGIRLEGTYTGKAFAAMLNDLQNKFFKNKVVLFWNTFCAEKFSDITSKVNYKDLPDALHNYFETDLQKLDQGL